MTYLRVMPRDLFNEASLLKCYGQLYLKLERYFNKNIELRHTGNAFVIVQNSNDGSLSITNIQLCVRGRRYFLYRPLNSREPWPLYAQEADYVEWSVFTDTGELDPQFLSLILDR